MTEEKKSIPYDPDFDEPEAADGKTGEGKNFFAQIPPATAFYAGLATALLLVSAGGFLILLRIVIKKAI